MDNEENIGRYRLVVYVLFICLLAYIFTSYANETYVNTNEIESETIMKYSPHGAYFETRKI